MNKKLFGLLALASLGASACAVEGGNREGNQDAPVTAPATPAATSSSGPGYTNALSNMANTYRQAKEASEAVERQDYFQRNTFLVSDGKTVMTQPESMRDHYDFKPKYLVEIRVNDIGGPRSYPVHSLSFCEVDAGANTIEGAVDRMRSFASSEEGARCGDNPQKTRLALPDQFRAALMHVDTCLPAIASYASKSAVPEDLKTRCQDFATLRF